MTADDRTVVVRGRPAHPGVAEGIALVCEATLTGWDTFDLATGAVKERGHRSAARA